MQWKSLTLAIILCFGGHAYAASISGGGGSGPPEVTAFPGSPTVGQVVLVIDDSATGACDSALGSARTYCYWTGAIWAPIGDGSGAGAGDISDVFTCAAGNCNALTATTGDSLNMASGDSSIPMTQSTTLPGTCTEGQQHQDTDSGESETYICTATNTWIKLASTTGNIATATALAANGANCSAGSSPLGVDASGAAETCTDYMEEPVSNGIVTKTGANTSTNRSVAGTSNQITVTNGDGVAGNPTLALSPTLVLPGAQVDFTETAGDGTCAAGDYWVKANSTTSTFRKCQNGTVTDLDTGGGGSIGGTVGTTDNAIVRADGTGGSTAQGSLVTIDDAGKVTAPGGFEAGTSGTGVIAMLEGTPPDAPGTAGEHNVYFDSGDSKLKSHENGGSVVTYARTVDNLGAFAPTTSAQLIGVLTDPTGTGASVFSNSPTLTSPVLNTPTFGGSAPTLADGVTWTFNPNNTSAGLNIGANATAPTVPNNGDLWYDSTANKFKCRENGATVDCINTSAGGGDVTAVNPGTGTGISITNPGGPVVGPVDWTPNNYAGNLTIWDGLNASRTWTANLSGATDPVWTYSDGIANLSTGTLQQAGIAVATATSTNAFTNKTLDCNGTGNICGIQVRVPIHVAGCNGSTAGPVWDLPTTSAAVPACVTGTNTQKGVLDFANGSNLSFQFHVPIPATWNSGNMSIDGKWFGATGSTNSVVWQYKFSCVADGETDDPAWDADVLAITDAGKATANQLNDFSGTINASTHLSGCAAGELLHVQMFRDSGHASDTYADTARLMPMELVYWVNQ